MYDLNTIIAMNAKPAPVVCGRNCSVSGEVFFAAAPKATPKAEAEDAEPEDKLSILEAAEIIGEMADNHADLSGDDPEDEDLWRKAEALTIAFNALQDLIEQGAK